MVSTKVSHNRELFCPSHERGLHLHFALPNIRWLTVLLAAYEIAAGVLVFMRSFRVRVGVGMMLVFLALITLNGYGFETTSMIEDFWKNRVVTLIMAISLIPLLLQPQPPAFLDSFRIRNQPS